MTSNNELKEKLLWAWQLDHITCQLSHMTHVTCHVTSYCGLGSLITSRTHLATSVGSFSTSSSQGWLIRVTRSGRSPGFFRKQMSTKSRNSVEKTLGENKSLTSLPYFWVKLSCVCLMFADRKSL